MRPILNFYGSFGQAVGYSGAAENIAVWLDKIGFDVRMVHFGKMKKNLLSPDGRMIAEKPFKRGEYAIVMGYPTSFTSIVGKYRKKIGITMFETDTLPKGILDEKTKIRDDWVKNCNSLDVLIVPCKHNKELFKKSGVKIPIEVVNQGVDPRLYHYYERPEKDIFTFLSLGKLTVRKNPGAILAAFLTLFRERPDVKLVLKTVSGTLGHLQMPYRNVIIVDRVIRPRQIVNYYRSADCFVWASRGEGFGLPPLEAMATGLPTIFPNHTGMAEYANEKYAYLINKHRRIPAQRYPSKFGNVGMWYDPDYHELKNLMAYVESHRREARKKGEMASEWVRNNFTYERTASKIREILQRSKL